MSLLISCSSAFNHHTLGRSDRIGFCMQCLCFETTQRRLLHKDCSVRKKSPDCTFAFAFRSLPPVPTVVGQLTATNGTTLESDRTVGSEYQYSYFSSYYSVATVVEAIFLKRVGNCANVMARSFVRSFVF